MLLKRLSFAAVEYNIHEITAYNTATELVQICKKAFPTFMGFGLLTVTLRNKGYGIGCGSVGRKIEFQDVGSHSRDDHSLDLWDLARVALMFPDGLSVGINTCKIVIMGNSFLVKKILQIIRCF